MTEPSAVRATYSIAEVAAMTGMSVSGIHGACRRGEIPSTRVGRRWLIPVEWVENLRLAATAASQAALPIGSPTGAEVA